VRFGFGLREVQTDKGTTEAREPGGDGWTDFRVAGFLISPSTRRVLGPSGRRVSIEPKIMQVLVRLAETPGRVVSRAELLDAVWPEEHITEHVLSRAISTLRKALDDDSREPRVIETIRKGGYRLLVPVERVSAAPFAPASRAPGATLQDRPGRRLRSRKGWTLGAAAAASVLAALVLVTGLAGLWRVRPGRTVDRTEALARPIPVTSFRGSEVDPALSPDGRRLAFSWNGPEGDNFDIYLRSLETELVETDEPLRLTEDPAEDKNPAWSPDGELLAFVRSSREESGIFVAPVVGGGERKLAACVSGDIPDLVWSGDGRYLFYPDREEAGEPSAIFRLDVETLERRRLTHPPADFLGDRDLTVSPDGRTLVTARAIVPGVEDLYVVEVAKEGASGGTAARRLTFDLASISGLEWLHGSTARSGEVLFSSMRDGTARLWRVSTQGGAPRPIDELGTDLFDPSYAAASGRLAFERKIHDANIWRLPLGGADPSPAEPWIASTRWDAAPAISPDGARIAFLSDRAGDLDLWIATADGTRLQRLSRGGGRIGRPKWSPDGAWLVYDLRLGEQTDLFRVRPPGGAPQRSTDTPWSERAPSFSPDGRSMYFGCDRTGEWQIWTMTLEGSTGGDFGAARQLTRGGGLRARPSADGRFLYYSRRDPPGIWRLTLGPRGGDVAEETPVLLRPGLPWADWDLGGDALYFRTESANPARAEPILRFDLETSEIVPVSEPFAARVTLGLGLAVAPREDYLLIARVDRSDDDLELVEGFR
jgi:Tol biopolymer transport system component/DNA-binding winged helix-turn-helix (wHTH) protein